LTFAIGFQCFRALLGSREPQLEQNHPILSVCCVQSISTQNLAITIPRPSRSGPRCTFPALAASLLAAFCLPVIVLFAVQCSATFILSHLSSAEMPRSISSRQVWGTLS
jgi:hypothetical protein